MSSVEQLVAPFITAEHVITAPILILSTEFFVYGIYCVIFGLAMHALFHHGSSAHILYKGGSIALFALATISTAVDAWGVSRQALITFDAATTKDYSSLYQYLLISDSEADAWISITDFSSTFMNSIADAMLIYRCYVIFNFRKFVLYPLAFAAFVLNSLDFGSIIAILIAPHNPHIDVEKAVVINNGVGIGIATFQILLTLMTGGRLWWITRKAGQLTVKRSTHSRFSNIVAIIIESALLYAGTKLVGTISDFIPDRETIGTDIVSDVFSTASALISGLAPTMVIAWVAYGKSVDSVQQTLSSFRVADIEAGQQTSIATRQAIVDHQLQTCPEGVD